MATLASQPITRVGTLPSYAAATGGGDKFTPGPSTCLHVKNGGGSAVTVTVIVPGSAFGQKITDVAVSVGAGTDMIIGPFPYEHFAGTGGLASITYSGVTSLTVAALALGQS